ncbi:endonuclease III [Jeotgalicoccus huakuii]|uniref:endonuclease III n=1 Tax=unclassified Jeotgalicoccus TaxID=2630462 RepID=UPI001415044F|nr:MULTISPECIES: endonuclease III [unclassified Jeotgalicoccus]MCK1976720.1 endonuclease III [Jeotgalicoccus huakuii]QQD86048.1 endonuclease III [Jeotgalicoccus sp. ATCC 8456]
MEMIDVIAEMFPEAEAELNYTNPFELTIAVLLSAQTTDVGVNRVTKGLFERFKTPEDYLAVDVEVIESYIKTIGLYRNKAKNIQKLCRDLIEKFNGEIPNNYDDLISLAGVGRKTANVVLSVAFDTPRIAVDTHVERISKRLGIARYKDSPLEVEETLMRKIPPERWSKTHHQLIFFGRYHCLARAPKCHECPLLEECREGQKRLKKGLVK